LPALSDAEHVTVVNPRAKKLPDSGEQALFEMPDSSIALKVQLAEAVGVLPLLGMTFRGDKTLNEGHDNVGEETSTFRIENEHVETLPAPSAAVQPTYVVPRFMDEVEETLQDWDTIPELSEDVTLKEITTNGSPSVGETE
jgi:hypothetical protein